MFKLRAPGSNRHSNQANLLEWIKKTDEHADIG